MASSSIIPFACFIFLFTTSALSTTNNFIFNGFKEAAAYLTLNGAARITSNGVLQLTNDTEFLIAHAFFSSPFQMLYDSSTQTPLALSFSTTFVFDIITVRSGGGHGFTFAIAPSRTLQSNHSQYLGLLSKNNNGKISNHVFAVEFDTVQGFALFQDIDNNHVGVDIDSLISNTSEPAAYYRNDSNKEDVDLESGSPIQAWIDYDGVGKILNVTIAPILVAKPHRPLISRAIDLSPIFKETMFVGFTASTGKLSSFHYILGWSFQINGAAHPLDLSQLPSPPKTAGSSQSTKAFGLKVGVASSFVTLLLVVLVIFVFIYLCRRAKLVESIEDWELNYPHRFPYKDLYRATKGFKETELLGSGGFGQVYKGVQPKSGEELAIKRISNSSRQGVQEFVAEIASLGRLRHRNLVHLHGWCKRDQDLILIYEFMPNNSLDTFLFNYDKNRLLSWDQRFKIVKDIASGLLYLHEEWEQVVVHRDIKASNILLDREMNAKLGDFGLARLYEHGSNPQTTCVVGTVGYIAPELACTGKATAFTDVYAYGMLLLEVVCGRRPIEPNAPQPKQLLLDWVKECWAKGQLYVVVDPRLGDSCTKEVELVLKLGLICSQSVPDARPTMRQVTQYLNGHETLADDTALVFPKADPWELALYSWDMASRSWDLASCSYPSSCRIPSTSSFKGGRC